MRLTRIICISFIISLFGCNNNSDNNSYNQKDYFSIIVPKDNLKLNTSEGNWYYKNIPFTGKAIVNYPNNKIQEEILYFKGKKNGVSSKYFINGTIQKKSFYKNNQLDGIVKTWWENGNLASESIYKNGTRNGIQKSWHPNGQMSRLNTLKNGIEEGLQQAWLDNGKIYVNCEMKNGRTFGLKRAILCYELKDEKVQYDEE